MLKISGSPLCRVFSSLTTTLTPVSLLLIILFFKGWKNRKTQAVPEKSVPGGGEGDARLLLPQDHKALQGEGSEDIWGGGGGFRAHPCCELLPAPSAWLLAP